MRNWCRQQSRNEKYCSSLLSLLWLHHCAETKGTGNLQKYLNGAKKKKWTRS